MLHTTDVDNKFQKIKFVDWFIRKNRDGELGKISTEYEGDFLRFHEKEFDKETGKWNRVNQEEVNHGDFIVDSDLPF